MLIVPGATAHLLTNRLGFMILLSALIAAASATGGHLLAIWGPGLVGYDPNISLNTSAMMAVVAGGLLVLALFFSPQYGLLGIFYRRTALSLQIVREDILGLLYRWQERQSQSNSPQPMLRQQLMLAVGGGWRTWFALFLLRRHNYIRHVQPASRGGDTLLLSDKGLKAASSLIRSHRLWESFLDKHTSLPADHLHEPAMRMEHFIQPPLQEQLVSELGTPDEDPHGKQIPSIDGE